MSHFYQPDDDTWEGRMDSYIEEAEKQITAFRAALEQERADNAKLRAFAQDCEDILGSDDEIQMLLNEHGLTDMDGVATALLSGRGEGGG